MWEKALYLGRALTVFLIALAPAELAAWQAEGGTKNCGRTIGFVHARYNDIAALTGPGTIRLSETPCGPLYKSYGSPDRDRPRSRHGRSDRPSDGSGWSRRVRGGLVSVRGCKNTETGEIR